MSVKPVAIQSRATSGFARNWRNIASWGVGLPGFFFRSVKLALAGAPFVLALSALVPVGWSTWITRSLADQAEKAGFIQVAVIQLANTCGAAVGGFTLDRLGLVSPLIPSGTLMLLTALLVTVKVKIKP